MIQRDKILKLFLLFIVVFLISNPILVNAAEDCKYKYNECIGPSDLGVNLVYTIKALPKYQDDYFLTVPKDSQVILWKEAGIYTTGASSDIDVRSKLKIYVEGAWAPWGHCPDILPSCHLVPCEPSNITTKIDQCFQNVVISGGKQETGQIITPMAALPDIPCRLDQGYGIYGMISIIQPDGTHKDPNDPEYLKSRIWPSAYFRTFEILANQSDGDGNYHQLDYTQVCKNRYTSTTNFTTNCTSDKLNGKEYAIKGWLYFKFQDTYYEDNTGEYKLTVKQGVFTQKGFIEKNFYVFNDIIVGVTKMMSRTLFENTQFLSVVRAFLVLYIVWSAMQFLMGSIRMTLNELLGRLLKFSIVSVLLTPSSFDFFNTYLLNVFIGNNPNNNYAGIAQEVASYVERVTLFYDPASNNTPRFAMPEDPTPLSVFDIILQMISSLNLHIKIWALLFYKWYFAYIIILYMGIFFLVAIVLRGTMLWFVATLRIAILLAVAPLFIMFMLFNVTKTYFENWLRQMMGAALTLIIVAASIALLIGLLTSQLQNLLNYEVCNMVIWSMDLDLIDVHFDINYWYPSDSRVDTALSTKNLFSFLIFGAIFDSFSKQIPQICDILGKMGIGSIGAMYGATGQGLNRIKSGVTQAAAGAVTVAKTAIAIKTGGTSKVVEGIAQGAEEAGKAAEKIGKGVSSAAKKR
jgi:type IV secretory pathway VirB6-like protein